ncbi:MAG: hypothetical protein JO057_07700 [Chloroflexi bacterium]|nr:hypothetical protein [Chloroflexota bacterium]
MEVDTLRARRSVYLSDYTLVFMTLVVGILLITVAGRGSIVRLGSDVFFAVALLLALRPMHLPRWMLRAAT